MRNVQQKATAYKYTANPLCYYNKRSIHNKSVQIIKEAACILDHSSDSVHIADEKASPTGQVQNFVAEWQVSKITKTV